MTIGTTGTTGTHRYSIGINTIGTPVHPPVGSGTEWNTTKTANRYNSPQQRKEHHDHPRPQPIPRPLEDPIRRRPHRRMHSGPQTTPRQLDLPMHTNPTQGHPAPTTGAFMTTRPTPRPGPRPTPRPGPPPLPPHPPRMSDTTRVNIHLLAPPDGQWTGHETEDEQTPTIVKTITHEIVTHRPPPRMAPPEPAAGG